MKQAYIKRKIESTILEAAKYFPVITVTGPRQSGKRTIIYAGTLEDDKSDIRLLNYRNM